MTGRAPHGGSHPKYRASDWKHESASRALMGFGELNDNMIKGLMLYLRYHEQRFICIS